jgi:hypothetical protein
MKHFNSPIKRNESDEMKEMKKRTFEKRLYGEHTMHSRPLNHVY